MASSKENSTSPLDNYLNPMSPSAVVLNNQDLSDLIVCLMVDNPYLSWHREADPYGGRDSYEQALDLVSASLISRSMQEAALNRLWESLGSMLPLLRLIPNFTLLNSGGKRPIHIFTTFPDEEDLRRFRYYARRVRFMTLDTGDCPVSAQVYLDLCNALGQHLTRVFPKLHKLRLPRLTEGSNSALSFLCLDSVTTIEVDAGGQHPSFDSFSLSIFSKIGSRHAFLRRLVIADTWGSTNINVPWDKLRLPYLQSLKIEVWAGANLARCFNQLTARNLVSLSNLEIIVGSRRLSTIPVIPILFKDLQSLALMGRQEIILQLLEIISLETLHSLKIDYVGLEDEESLDIQSVAKLVKSRAPILRHLHMTALYDMDWGPDTTDWKDIEDFSTIPNLETLSLLGFRFSASNHSTEAQNAVFKKFMTNISSNHNLRVLELAFNWAGVGSPPPLDLHGFLDLLSRFAPPNLSSVWLSLAVNYNSTLYRPLGDYEPLVKANSIRHLQINDTTGTWEPPGFKEPPTEVLQSISRFINTKFPHLVELWAKQAEDDGYGREELWGLLENLWRDIKRVKAPGWRHLTG